MTIADAFNLFLQDSEKKVAEINAERQKKTEVYDAKLQELDRQIREIKQEIANIYAETENELGQIETMNAGALAYHNFLRDAGILNVEALANFSAPVEPEAHKIKFAAKVEIETSEDEPAERPTPEIKNPDFDLDEYDESFAISGEDEDEDEDEEALSGYVAMDELVGKANLGDENEDLDDEDDYDGEEENDNVDAADEDDYDEDEWDDYLPAEAYSKYYGLTPEQEEKARKMDAERAKYGDGPVLWPLRKNTEYCFDPDKYEYVPVMLGSSEAEERGIFSGGYGNYEDDGVETGEGYEWDIKEPTPASQVSDELKRRRKFVCWLHGEAQETTLRSGGACFLGKPKRLSAIKHSELEFAAKNRPDMFDAYVDQRYAVTGSANRVKIFGCAKGYYGEEPDFELIKTMIEHKSFRLNVKEYMTETGQSFESFKLMWNRLSRTSLVPYCRFVLNRNPRTNEEPGSVDSNYGKCRFDEVYIEMIVERDPEECDSLKMMYELATQ